MPIYEYVCHTCGEEFEAIQKFTDAPLAACHCGKKGRVERKLSLSAFHLQGGGWYKDRYGAEKGKSDSNGAGNGTGGKPGAEAKPAAEGGKSEGSEGSKSGGTAGETPASS